MHEKGSGLAFCYPYANLKGFSNYYYCPKDRGRSAGADTKEDLEDWLLSQDPEFIKKMRKAREDDLKGAGRDWEQIKKELCIE